MQGGGTNCARVHHMTCRKKSLACADITSPEANKLPGIHRGNIYFPLPSLYEVIRLTLLHRYHRSGTRGHHRARHYRHDVRSDPLRVQH